MKTNAARLLDTLNIQYEFRTYAVDPEDLQAHYTLMLAYGALGRKAEAERERQLYLRFKANESAQEITGSGSLTLNRAPGGVPSTSTVPPWPSAISASILEPRPEMRTATRLRLIGARSQFQIERAVIDDAVFAVRADHAEMNDFFPRSLPVPEHFKENIIAP